MIKVSGPMPKNKYWGGGRNPAEAATRGKYRAYSPGESACSTIAAEPSSWVRCTGSGCRGYGMIHWRSIALVASPPSLMELLIPFPPCKTHLLAKSNRCRMNFPTAPYFQLH